MYETRQDVSQTLSVSFQLCDQSQSAYLPSLRRICCKERNPNADSLQVADEITYQKSIHML